MVKDPVCGMNIEEEQAAGTCRYQGRTYYFCAPGCKREFEQEPEKYVHKLLNEIHVHNSNIQTKENQQ
ncbi:MAG: YHS domain-containing protein [Bacteroidetes bacterium]|nr:MAG: YHS domain-containing protein [Bacteroidota bacterium]